MRADLQHALVAAFLLLTALDPLWVRRLKRSPSPRIKLRFYAATLVGTLLIAVAALGLEGGAVLWWPGRLGWPPSARLAALAAVALVVGWQLVLAVRSLSNEKLRGKLLAAVEGMRFFAPSTTAERRVWIALSINAGISEEIIARGFFIRYFAVSPWHLGLTAAVLLASAIFGFGHLYQGARGIVSTGVAGILFALLFLFSRSLFLPMLLHALVDLSLLLFVRQGEMQWTPQAA